jgi:hypothetical protein
MRNYKLIYQFGTLVSRKTIIKQHGKVFYKKFCKSSKEWIDRIAPQTPDIGNTVFSMNYAFTPSYIAWWKAACEQLQKEQADKLLWTIKERVFSLIPKRLAPTCIKLYMNNFRKKAPIHVKLHEQGRLHSYDYKIKYQEINDETFEIDFYECGMLKLARAFDAEGMFPSICRIDYLMFSLGGAGFERTKTLGDGDNCCNCRYVIGGKCEWAPEKGFADRK